jgi:hypothetical protein
MSVAIRTTKKALTPTRKKYSASTRPAIVEARSGKTGNKRGHIISKADG